MIKGKTKSDRLKTTSVDNFPRIVSFYGQFLRQKEKQVSVEDMSFDFIDIFHPN